ncbi:MAG: glycerol-3-phosphate 1-O-acyltransferase PlsY [Coriobacteriia bacterium]|nr:glycerol-3-phosphate 1-O-acyltransferase PlsY [Coriobacteriia bacterium]
MPLNYLDVPGFLPIYPLMVIGALVLAYLCGSIPFALIIGRIVAGIDIRQHGSGNVGTANTLRTLGWGPGLLVFVFDVLKAIVGCLIVTFALTKVGAILLEYDPSTLQSADRFQMAYGITDAGPLHDIPLALAVIACILGHMFSPFMHFKGGKGVAAALGGFLVVTPVAALLAFSVFLLCTLLSRIVSVGSIVAVISLPAWIAVFHGGSLTYIVFGIMAMMVMVAAHKKNIIRLMHHEEPRFSIGSTKKALSTEETHGSEESTPAAKDEE